MKRLFVAAALCAAFLLPVGAAARVRGRPAAPRPRHEDASRREPQPDASADRGAGAVRARFVPLARTLTGTATVKVHAYDYSGNPWVGAAVRWWVTTETEQASGSGYTDSAGLDHVHRTCLGPTPGRARSPSTRRRAASSTTSRTSPGASPPAPTWACSPARSACSSRPAATGATTATRGSTSTARSGDAQQYTGSSVPADVDARRRPGAPRVPDGRGGLLLERPGHGAVGQWPVRARPTP